MAFDHKAYNRKYYQKNKSTILSRSKEYYSNNTERVKSNVKKWKSENPERSRELANKGYQRRREEYQKYSKEYRVKNRHKTRAKSAVANRIRAGKLGRPKLCSICNKGNCRIVGHHDDYDKPYQIKWVCDSCHKKIHYYSLLNFKG